MEQNTPLMAKKIWNVLRVAFYMLRKGICKRKILMDLNLVMKRGKIARKALQNIMFHNHHDSSSEASFDSQFKPQGGEYEFSCSNTPLYRHYFNNKKSKLQHSKNFSFEDLDNIEGVNNMFDMIMLSSNEDMAKSPALPGLGPGLGLELNSRAKQIRVTDSPFPTQNGEDGKHVDVAADEFIKNFYSQLKQQKYY
ncbi:uncharacterized protein LOC141612843 [Silene latifolia]|uniref:uncharacterized protein LOC141612843 n=1 Tax=Silene latifolia TaxID=37657 RepID=UPI003D78984D